MSSKKIDIKKTEYYQYAQNVIKGKVVAGELIQLACKRFMSDLKRKDLVFKADKVENFLKFSKCLKHFKGSAAGTNFHLEPWQQFIAANILGFYWKDDDVRRYTTSIVCMSRKSGKTALSALFCLWFMLFDGEEGSEVDLAANSLEQANVAFEFCEMYARQLDPQGRDLRTNRKQIYLKGTASKINVFASDASKLDGFNAHFALIDEMHSAKDTKMIDVLRSSMGQRKQPHLMVISTSGFDLTSPFHRMCQVGEEILRGTKTDDSQFLALYHMDENDDWKDEKNWVKSNPNLGITVTKKYLRDQVVEATNNPSSEVGILTKNFNVWCRTSDIWIPDKYVLECMKDKFDLSKFKGNDDIYVTQGTDFSAVSDLTALATVVVDENNEIWAKLHYYIPQQATIESPNRDKYKQWEREGYCTISEGNVTDLDLITKDIVKINNDIPITKIFYDAWMSLTWAVKATEMGLPIEPCSQSIGNFSKGTKELEKLIRSNKIHIDNNPITLWMFRNVQIKTDFNGNCLALDTKVPTTTGFKRIDEIQVGDYVFGSDGKPTKVTYVTDVNYDRDCYKLTFNNGSEVVADYTHQWYVNYYSITKDRKTIKKYGKKNTEWLYKHYLNGQGHCNRHTVYCQPVEYEAKTYTVDPYTLGQWLGDGCSWGSTFTCSEEDLHMYDYLSDKYNVKYVYEEKKGNYYTIYVSGGLRTELKNLGLLKNKHIPEEYFEGDVQQRLALIQGLMDTDGSCNKYNGQCTFSNKNYDLAYGIHRLLNSLGIRNSINSYFNDYGENYIVSCYTNTRLFRLDRKFNRQSIWKSSDLTNHNPLLKVEKVDSVPTKCITVDNKDNLFLITDNYLVTSNCKPSKEYCKSEQKIDGIIALIEALMAALGRLQYSNELTII